MLPCTHRAPPPCAPRRTPRARRARVRRRTLDSPLPRIRQPRQQRGPQHSCAACAAHCVCCRWWTPTRFASVVKERVRRAIRGARPLRTAPQAVTSAAACSIGSHQRCRSANLQMHALPPSKRGEASFTTRGGTRGQQGQTRRRFCRTILQTNPVENAFITHALRHCFWHCSALLSLQCARCVFTRQVSRRRTPCWHCWRARRIKDKYGPSHSHRNTT